MLVECLEDCDRVKGALRLWHQRRLMVRAQARSDTRLREHIEDALAGVRRSDPHERHVRVKAAVEVEDETVRRK